MEIRTLAEICRILDKVLGLGEIGCVRVESGGVLGEVLALELVEVCRVRSLVVGLSGLVLFRFTETVGAVARLRDAAHTTAGTGNNE